MKVPHSVASLKDTARNLIITVKEIKGNCPIYETGDKILIDEGYKLNLQETKALCMPQWQVNSNS